jgi:hypothetical protein
MDVINRTLDLKQNFINMIFNFLRKERTSFNRMYNHYLHIIDPFLYVNKRKSNRISKGLPIDVKPIRFIHRYDEYTTRVFKYRV